MQTPKRKSMPLWEQLAKQKSAAQAFAAQLSDIRDDQIEDDALLQEIVRQELTDSISDSAEDSYDHYGATPFSDSDDWGQSPKKQNPWGQMPHNPFAPPSKPKSHNDDIVERLKDLLKNSNSAKTKPAAPKAKNDEEVLGAISYRDLIVAKKMGHTAAEFEHKFKRSALSLILGDSERDLDLTLKTQFQWALESGAQIDLLMKEKPHIVFKLLLVKNNIDIAEKLLSEGFQMPELMEFKVSNGNTRGSPLHALFSAQHIYHSKSLREAAHILSERFSLSARDEQGYTPLGRLNHQLNTMTQIESNQRALIVSVFEYLVTRGADATALAPCPTLLAADPAIARAVRIEMERKELEEASRPKTVKGSSKPQRL